MRKICAPNVCAECVRLTCAPNVCTALTCARLTVVQSQFRFLACVFPVVRVYARIDYLLRTATPSTTASSINATGKLVGMSLMQ